jgi:hypothetical protein
MGRKPRTAVQVDAVKGSRTWNRREFAVTANGFFTILKPTGWFATIRLPGGFRYLLGQSKGTASSQARENPPENPPAAPPAEPASVPEKYLDQADSQQTAILSQSMILGTDNHHPMRPALIVLAATAIPLIFLWLLHAYP